MKKNKTLSLILIIIVTFLISIIFKSRISSMSKVFPTKIKSGNLSTDYTIDKALYDIHNLGLNTINIPIVIIIEDLNSDTMDIDQESMERAIELITYLNRNGIKTILEPYPWIANGSEYETNWNPRDINTFFWNWKTKVLKVLIDNVAVPYSVDVLNIGTSFNYIEYAEEYWIDTIEYVRKYYKGLVTYRTSWWVTASWDTNTTIEYEAKINNKLFSKLDFISIAAYFELTDKDQNSISDLVDALESTKIFNRNQNIKKEIRQFYNKWDKPIFFGELGFPKTIKASIHPWNPFQSTTIDNVEQANCFEAYRLTFENEPWLIGFSVFSIGEDSNDKLYYPSDKSADIIKNWYSK